MQFKQPTFLGCLLFLSAFLAHKISAEDIIIKNEVNGVTFAEPENYELEFDVSFMQEDRIIEGNILMVTGYGFFTMTPELEASPVADYREMSQRGAGTVTSFAQHNGTTLIIVDVSNDCLQWLTRIDPTSDQPDFSVTVFAGSCSTSNKYQSKEGTFEEARFNQPEMIVMGQNNERYFVTDQGNGEGVVKVVDFTRGTVTVFFGEKVEVTPPWRFPHAMVFVDERKTLYISTENNLYSAVLNTGMFSAMTSGIKNIKDGELKDSEFKSSHALESVTDNVLLVLPGVGREMRVVDLENEMVSTVLLPDVRQHSCALKMPSQKKVYFGGRGGLSIMSYEVTDSGSSHQVGLLSVIITLMLAHLMA